MRNRGRVVALGLALVGLSALLAACAPGNESARLTVGGPREYRGAYLLPPLARPDTTLTDTSGQRFDFQKATDDELTILFFGYTYCPDVCPTTMADIAAGLRLLSPERRAAVKVVFVTTDPLRDTPALLRRWLDNFDPSFIGLTGPQRDINELMASLRLPSPVEEERTSDGYLVSHSSDVLLFTPDNVAHLVYVGGAPASDWAADLDKLLAEGFKEP